jgi:hypothetical protein
LCPTAPFFFFLRKYLDILSKENTRYNENRTSCPQINRKDPEKEVNSEKTPGSFHRTIRSRNPLRRHIVDATGAGRREDSQPLSRLLSAIEDPASFGRRNKHPPRATEWKPHG